MLTKRRVWVYGLVLFALIAGMTVLMLFGGAPRVASGIQGNGTADNPYILSSAEDLAQLAQETNASGGASGVYYALGNDIDLTHYLSVSGAGYNGGKGFVPIGLDAQHAFRGVLDGGGYTVTGLFIHDTSLKYAGLFGYTYGTVRDINIEGAEITAAEHVGTVAGFVNAGVILNAQVTDSAVRGSKRVGGIVGELYNSSSGLSRSSFSGSVQGAGSGSAFDEIGGLTGYIANSKIAQSFVYGADVSGRDSVGGIVGHISSSATPSIIEQCYFVDGTVSGRNYVGGIAGDVNRTNANANSFIINCYASGSVRARNFAGGIAGYLYDGSITSSAALNQSVVADITDNGGAQIGSAGRITGYKNAGTLSNNIAFSRMQSVDGLDVGAAFLSGEFGLDRLNGEDIKSGEILFDATLGGRFNAPVWTVEEGKLPSFDTPHSVPNYLLPLAINAGMFNAVAAQTYNGLAHTPQVSAVNGEVTFTITAYRNNVNAGLAEIEVAGTGDWGGTAEIAFTINQAVPAFTEPLNLTAVYGDTLADVALPEGWAWVDNLATSVGTAGERGFLATFTPVDTDNFITIVFELTLNVALQPVAIPQVIAGLVFNGESQTGVDFDNTLTAYELVGGFTSGTTAGTYIVRFSLRDNYIWSDGTSGDISLTWTIGTLSGAAQVSMPDFVFSGNAAAPSVAILSGEWDSTVFEFSSDNFTSRLAAAPIDAGVYYVRAVLTQSPNQYADLLTDSVQFKILPLTLTNQLGLVSGQFIYNGLPHTPAPALHGDMRTARDYTVSYQNNVHVGLATVTVTGVGNYAGAISVTFAIVPAPLTVTPVAGQSKIFGESDPTLAFTAEGLYGGDTLSGLLSRQAGENAGQYLIQIGTLANPDYQIQFVSEVIFTVEKAHADAPLLRIASATDNSLTVSAVEGAEYKLNNGEWQSSNVFTGLDAKTDYTVYIRFAETENFYQSEESSAHFVTAPPPRRVPLWLWFIIGLIIGSILTVVCWFVVKKKKTDEKPRVNA
ncbi:MAG: hypothetical protein FWH03_03475 [Firmicutes bacterium]|nr:hypothetical protein [Bacillota bacterium]